MDLKHFGVKGMQWGVRKDKKRGKKRVGYRTKGDRRRMNKAIIKKYDAKINKRLPAVTNKGFRIAPGKGKRLNLGNIAIATIYKAKVRIKVGMGVTKEQWNKENWGNTTVGNIPSDIVAAGKAASGV